MDSLISQILQNNRCVEKTLQKLRKDPPIDSKRSRPKVCFQNGDQVKLLAVENERLQRLIKSAHETLEACKLTFSLEDLPSSKVQKNQASTASLKRESKIVPGKQNNDAFDLVGTAKRLREPFEAKPICREDTPGLFAKKNAETEIKIEKLALKMQNFVDETQNITERLLTNAQKNEKLEEKLKFLTKQIFKMKEFKEMRDKSKRAHTSKTDRALEEERRNADEAKMTRIKAGHACLTTRNLDKQNTTSNKLLDDQIYGSTSLYKPLVTHLFSKLELAHSKSLDLAAQNERLKVKLQNAEAFLHEQKLSNSDLQSELRSQKIFEAKPQSGSYIDNPALSFAHTRKETSAFFPFENTELKKKVRQLEQRLAEMDREFKAKEEQFIRSSKTSAEVHQEEISNLSKLLDEARESLRALKLKLTVLGEENAAIKQELAKEIRIRKSVEAQLADKITNFEEKCDLFKSFELELKEAKAKTVRYTFLS